MVDVGELLYPSVRRSRLVLQWHSRSPELRWLLELGRSRVDGQRLMAHPSSPVVLVEHHRLARRLDTPAG